MQITTNSPSRHFRRFFALLLVSLALLPLKGLAHGAIDEQLRALDIALKQTPNDPALIYRQAELHVAHDDREAAARTIAQVEALAPDRYPTPLLRARLALGAGLPAQAETLLAGYLATHPDELPALLLRARTRIALGRPTEALTDYRNVWAHTAAPDCELIQEVADALSQIAPDDAVAVLEAGLKRHGAVPSLLLRALALDLRLAHFDSALQRVHSLQNLSPQPELWMSRRAEILTQAGRPAEARTAWQDLLHHLATLPNLERGTPAMRQLSEHARASLAALP